MIIIDNFKISVNKQDVTRAVNSYYNLNHFDDITKVYRNMHKLAVDNITPFGAFEIEKKGTATESSSSSAYKFDSSILQNCSYLIYCIFTIGDNITDLIEELFDKDKFNEAIMLDAISTSILFNLSKQMYDNIYEFSREKNLGLTCRIAPGDGEIDINYQKDIIDKFDNLEEYKFHTVNDYIIKPYKTLTYIYGADINIKINREDHHCNRCHNKNCFMRNSTEKTRGAFIESDIEDSND